MTYESQQEENKKKTKLCAYLIQTKFKLVVPYSYCNKKTHLLMHAYFLDANKKCSVYNGLISSQGFK
jgi:hypothetical protein